MAEHTVFALARLADCADPDGPESAGARFLESIASAVDEQVGYAEGGLVDRDVISEIADGAPDVYTHAMWAEFIDLAAYNEDPSELGADASDMEQCARVCLYLIAERLAQALAEEAVFGQVTA